VETVISLLVQLTYGKTDFLLAAVLTVGLLLICYSRVVMNSGSKRIWRKQSWPILRYVNIDGLKEAGQFLTVYQCLIGNRSWYLMNASHRSYRYVTRLSAAIIIIIKLNCIMLG
jgi:hypothetical protein